MTGANKVIDDMRGRGISAGTAEPFTACKATNNAGWVVDTTIARNFG